MGNGFAFQRNGKTTSAIWTFPFHGQKAPLAGAIEGGVCVPPWVLLWKAFQRSQLNLLSVRALP